MTKNESMTVAAFFDGRPGHEKQTRGILDRLAEKITVETIPICVERVSGVKQAAQLVRLLAGTDFPGPDLSRCNLLLGTGTPTHIPILHAKRYFRIPAVICMTPLPLLRNGFDLIITPRHDKIRKTENVFFTTGPPNPNRNRKRHQENKVLILCGGADEKAHLWNTDKIIGDIELLIQYESGKEFVISTSPRTPADMSTALAALADHRDNVKFFDFHDTPAGWVESEYQKSAYVWVTGDSVSMVYEALSAGCKVGVLPVIWRRQQSKFKRSLDSLYAEGHVVSLEDHLKGDDTWKEDAVFNEAERCAEEILKRYIWNR